MQKATRKRRVIIITKKNFARKYCLFYLKKNYFCFFINFFRKLCSNIIKNLLIIPILYFNLLLNELSIF